MAENNENKIRRRKVSSTNLKNTNNNRNTIKNSNNTKNKSKNSRNNKKKSSVQDIKRKQEEKEQFELEREIYYRKKKIKRKRRLKLITRLASLCLILLVIGDSKTKIIYVVICVAISAYIAGFLPVAKVNTIGAWLVCAFVVTICFTIIGVTFSYLFFKDDTKALFNMVVGILKRK